MSSIFTTALLGSAVVVGSVLAGTLAYEAKRTVKPCVGELCPPKSPIQIAPAQRAIQTKTKDANQGEQMQGQNQSSGQVIPRKKPASTRSRFDPNRRSASTGKIDKETNTTAVVSARADKKINATALVTATADKADNGITKKRVLWPYERRN